MRQRWPILCAALIAAATASTVPAEMYKWRDDEGQVHYSESPPPGRPSETIKPPPPVDSGKALEDLDKQVEQFGIRADERADQADEANKKAAEDQQRQADCAEVRDRAEHLGDAPRSYRVQPDGTRIIQTEEEHQVAIAKARAWIDLNCKP
jgi:hypothetical protein